MNRVPIRLTLCVAILPSAASGRNTGRLNSAHTALRDHPCQRSNRAPIDFADADTGGLYQ